MSYLHCFDQSTKRNNFLSLLFFSFDCFVDFMLRDEINIIKSQGFEPCVSVQEHLDSDGNSCSCCIAAKASFCSEVIAASSFSSDNIDGVLLFLQKKFSWGVERCYYLCEILSKARTIDCGSGMGIALMALNASFQHNRKDFDFGGIHLAAVQLIMKTDSANTKYFRGLLDTSDTVSENHRWIWTTENLCYHQCVGLFSSDSKLLRIWDFDGWLYYDTEKQCLGSGIVSIRITPTVYGHHHSSINNVLLWDGVLPIPFGVWVDCFVEAFDGRFSTSPGGKILQKVGPLLYPPMKKSNFSSDNIQSDDVNYPASVVRIYISSCHMSSTPFPGIGVARCLRFWHALGCVDHSSGNVKSLGSIMRPSSLILIGVDDMDADPLCGLTDPCFDSTKDLMILSQMRRSSSKRSEFQDLASSRLWDEIREMLNDGFDNNVISFFIPCIDIDTYFLANRIACEREHAERMPAGMESRKRRIQAICDSILCPTLDALTLTEKPDMKGVAVTELFKIPEYYILLPPTQANFSFESALIDAQSFCDKTGYPVLVKGEQHGAQVCHSWSAVSVAVAPYLNRCSHSRCFIQRIMRGTEKTIAFGAINGKLTGCLLMTKTIITDTGKVWSGIISAVSVGVMHAIEKLVESTKWHGGGELEFIETIEDGLQIDVSGKWYLIDFNPRFPAWIGACCYTGCNLPGDLLSHACLNRLIKQDSRLSSDDELRKSNLQRYLSVPQFAFSKSVVEVPVVHHAIGPQSRLLGDRYISCLSKSKSCLDFNAYRVDETLMTRVLAGADIGSHPTPDIVCYDHELMILTNKVLDDRKGISTPSYLLSRSIVLQSLSRHQKYLANAIAAANDMNGSDSVVELQMSLSVKTQPIKDVLVSALSMGYFAECISLAEVRGAIQAGFKGDNIILTGPGKMWDNHLHQDIQALSMKPFIFGAIFADSLMDLHRIVRRIVDPDDWLKASLIGLRFQPPGVHSSRFGLNPHDAGAFKLAAAIVRNYLPQNVKLGIHFHFAASAPSMSPEKWFGMAHGIIEVARQFSVLCRRNIDAIDFGGGFPCDFFDHLKTSDSFVSLISSAQKKLASRSLVIEFELGKCITERSGALITRILEIRELWVGGDDDIQLESADKDISEIFGPLCCKRKALIVDASVGEICCLHVHPIYWRSAAMGSSLWHSFSSGSDEIWGRTCMEFDQLVGIRSSWGSVGGRCGTGVQCIAIPKDIEVGDFILITCCGSYDMSMQYDFGDGVGRKNCIVSM